MVRSQARQVSYSGQQGGGRPAGAAAEGLPAAAASTSAGSSGNGITEEDLPIVALLLGYVQQRLGSYKVGGGGGKNPC